MLTPAGYGHAVLPAAVQAKIEQFLTLGLPGSITIRFDGQHVREVETVLKEKVQQ